MNVLKKHALAEQTTPTPDPHRLIQARDVCDMIGGVSQMTLWRWLQDASLGFPRPIYIGRRRYWREADIVAWLEAQA